MKKLVITSVIGRLMTAGVDLASPAAAGCNTVAIGIFGGGQRCDGPIDPSGQFTRCDRDYGMGIGGSRCYVVRFGDLGQPPYVP
jgi:hypothetical protein